MPTQIQGATAPEKARQPRRKPSHLVSIPNAPEGQEAAPPKPEMTPEWAKQERARLEMMAVQDMNRTHAAMLLGGQAVVIVEDTEGTHSLTSFKALSDWLACKPLRVPMVNERTERVEVKRTDRALVWKLHEHRRNVTKMNFAPERDLGPAIYNTWKGWQIKPLADDGAAAQPILRHIREVWCVGDTMQANWVLSWLAQMVQQPCSKPGTALVLRGKEGVGKGILAGLLLRRLLGPAFVQITQPGQVTGRFNSIWQSKLAVFADEAFWAGDKPAEGVLKGLITEPKLAVEYKGKDVVEIDHHARVIFASNSEWVVPAGETARRFCVLDVAEKYRGDETYFKALQAAVEGDGAASFLAYLKSYDITGVNLRKPPVTEALLEQKIHSLESVPRWWRERLWLGFIDDPERRQPLEVDQGEWPSTVLCEQLYDSYTAYSEKVGIRRPEGEAAFAKKLREFCPVERKRETSGKRRWFYEFPKDETSTFNLLRGHFEKWIGGSLTWAGDEAPTPGDGEGKTSAVGRKPNTIGDHLDDQIPF
jgi:hypothetical protein